MYGDWDDFEEIRKYYESLTEEEVAYHEAGHAVVAWILGMQLLSCMVVPKHKREEDKPYGTVVTAEDSCYSHQMQFLVYMAGVAAERYRGSKTPYFTMSSDYTELTKLALNHFDMSADGVSRFVKGFGMPVVNFLVKTYWSLIEALAKELEAKKFMSAIDVDVFLREQRIYELSQLDFGPIVIGN